MTDYQILTIIAAFIIVDIAVLSLVAIPLMRRRLAARIDRSAEIEPPDSEMLTSDPIGAPSAGRLAAAIGARPTLSAPVPTATGGGRTGDLPGLTVLPRDPAISPTLGDIGENEAPATAATDVIEAIAAARAATEAWQHPTSAATDSDDAQDEADSMDPAEMSLARARGLAIHPEDPLVASTIDRLLGARRETDAPESPSAADAAPETGRGTDSTTEVDGDARATNGMSEAGRGSQGQSRAEGEPAGQAASTPGRSTPGGERPTTFGRPVMATGSYTSEGVLEPTIDAETGLDSQLTWANTIAIEEARSGRYGRPVSVVVAELDGLEKLTDLFGADVADKLIAPVADALRRSARAADRVARLGHHRFGVLLVETDEVRAINYVERVRAACDRWLEASAIALRLSIGWASPATDGDVRSAVRIAEDRMYREQRRPAPWGAPGAGGAPTTTED